jgi:hypothetical protein
MRLNCNYDYIQDCLFPGQRGAGKVCFLFKMSTHGRRCGVDIVRRMSTDGCDLRKSWVVFDHVKRVEGSTTLAAHIYDPHYRGIMTIATCDMKAEDGNTQALFWRLLNLTCLEHGVPKVDFHGFMADEA